MCHWLLAINDSWARSGFVPISPWRAACEMRIEEITWRRGMVALAHLGQCKGHFSGIPRSVPITAFKAGVPRPRGWVGLGTPGQGARLRNLLSAENTLWGRAPDSADTGNIPRHCTSLPQNCKPCPKPNPKYCEENRGESHVPLLKGFVHSPSARTKEIKTQNNSNIGLLFTFNISFLFAPPKIFSYIKTQLKY